MECEEISPARPERRIRRASGGAIFIVGVLLLALAIAAVVIGQGVRAAAPGIWFMPGTVIAAAGSRS